MTKSKITAEPAVGNACPICNQTDSTNCSISKSGETAYCGNYTADSPDVSKGFYFTERFKGGYNGPGSIAIYSKRKPKKPKTTKTESPNYIPRTRSEADRKAHENALDIEIRVHDLVAMVKCGSLSAAQAGNELSTWCKEHGHFGGHADKMLREGLKAVDAPHPDDQCAIARLYRRAEAKFGEIIRFNSMTKFIEIEGVSIDPEFVRLRIALDHNIDLKGDASTICMHLAKEREYNPVINYLDACQAAHGPDDDLLNKAAATYFGATTSLESMYVRKTLIAAVARAREPGCKFDYVLVLYGGTGYGKSTFFRMLSNDFFDDNFGDAKDKDERLRLHQTWFLEWGEIDRVTQSRSAADLKNFITSQRDVVRPPYGKTAIPLARPSIIVGTTNRDDFLNDPTGNRRYWIVAVKKGKLPREQLLKDRDRIWAAACHAYDTGELPMLDPTYEKMSAIANAHYMEAEVWEGPVAEYVKDLPMVTARDVLEQAINIPLAHIDKRSESRITNLLKQWGWKKDKRKVKGIRNWWWINPEIDENLG
ncbi:MAG: virulence-associated E family protein, partial [Cyanobacteria bacterium P01_D01_bin.14]